MQADAQEGPRAIGCPGCGGTVALRAEGYTVTLVCEYCGSILDVANPDVRLIEKYSEAQAQLAIPLGTRGTLRGVEWETIGYLRRSDSGVDWEEYLLFNPYHGYRWLVASSGQWSFGTMLTASPAYDGGKLAFDGRRFEAFYRHGHAQVVYVLGEFYWRVKAGDAVDTADYVRPGAMLSLEQDEFEKSWTLNELLAPGEIAAAFPVPRPPGWLPGITPAPHQPSPVAPFLRGAWWIAVLAACALFVLLLMFGGTRGEQRFVLSVRPDGPSVTRTFGPIVLPARYQAVTIRTSTPAIEQGWVDIDLAFVDRKSQASYEAYSLNEHYFGQDSDGPWSEGDRARAVKMATLPAGTYDLVVDARAQSWTGGRWSGQQWDQRLGRMASPPVDVRLVVGTGARFFSNLLLALILILLPLVLAWWLHHIFEKARLAQSDDAEDE